MTKTCCDRKEVTCFKLLSQAHIESVRRDFYYKMTEIMQTQKVLDYMRDHCRDDKSILYTIAGQEVCETCYRMTLGIRYNRYMSIKAKFLGGAVIAEHGRVGRGSYSSATIRVVSWLRMFFHKVGDNMPVKKEVHLPSCLTKGDVYALAVDDLSQGGLECCKISTFYQIWKQEFPHVKIPKVM